MKNNVMILLGVIGMAMASAQTAVADPTNWADGVDAFSSKIQNYAGTLMTEETEFWVTGPPDADTDNNGYVLDAVDNDYVAGWRSNAPDEFLVVHFDIGLADIPGDDLSIYSYGGPIASGNVLASTDGLLFEPIGTVSGGTPGYLNLASFDFDGLFGARVHYVKVERVTNGSQAGLFFDAFGGVSGLPGDFDMDGDTDGADFLMWQRGESPDPLSQADLASWLENFGNVANPVAHASAVVPEAASVLLLVWGVWPAVLLARICNRACCA